MSRPWVMLYTELVNDPKMIMLSDSAYRRFIELLLYAGETDRDGEIASTTFIAVKCRKSLAELQPDLDELAAAGIIRQDGDLWYISKWAERQPPTTAADRVRKHREKKRQEKEAKPQAKPAPAPEPRQEVTLPPTEGVTLQQRSGNVQIREEKKREEGGIARLGSNQASKGRQPAPAESAPPDLEPEYFHTVSGIISLGAEPGELIPSSNGHAEPADNQEAIRVVMNLMRRWEDISGGRWRNDDERRDDFFIPCNKLLKRLGWDVDRAAGALEDAYRTMVDDGLTPRKVSAVLPQVYAKLGKDGPDLNWIDKYFPQQQVPA